MTEKYDAHAIDVLEGLEPVRHRPGMYIGGTDESAYHHLASEVLDNAMDEAVAGFASRIDMHLGQDGYVTITDDGRGIPVDPHPKFPDKTALEVIFTTLHSGGKFTSKAYNTSGGLHGVGISVVNALSDEVIVEVARNKQMVRQRYVRGAPTCSLENVEKGDLKQGTRIRFHPDPDIFGTQLVFKPKRLYQLAKSKAYLYKGVSIFWSCDSELLNEKDGVPEHSVLHFPKGLLDYLESHTTDLPTITPLAFAGEVSLPDNMHGKVEWAITWRETDEVVLQSYCNTIPTPQGGAHEQGLRAALLKGIRQYAEMRGVKKLSALTADDVFAGSFGLLSVFIQDPQFQGQTKEKLVNQGVSRPVENAIRDYFDHWLSANNQHADALLAFIQSTLEERLNRKTKRDVQRKSITKSMRLPGKLADCRTSSATGTEIFLVEGDSAGGSAKQGRNPDSQAVLPLRGKILNVASATKDKIQNNQIISDLELALGCARGTKYNSADLRYEKVIIMTDADVDGAHIASLLMTFFYLEMRGMIEDGRLYLAVPPLYKLTQGSKSYYVTHEEEKEKIMKQLSKQRGTIDVSRFKGLGEMTPKQLRETTMDPEHRALLKVMIAEETHAEADQRVDELMGKNPEHRFRFIQEHTQANQATIKNMLDI